VAIKNLFCDLESYSDVSLTKSGVYRYCDSPDFEVMLFGYAVDGGEVKVVDLMSGEDLPPEVLSTLTDDSVTKWAHNAAFERVCLSRHLGLPEGSYLDPSSWRCTMIHSAYLGLPHSLEGAGAILGLDKQKLAEGKELIRYFCRPCRATKSNGGRTRNLPADAPERWKAFKAYNARDVEAEMGIARRLARFPVPDNEWESYILDQSINDRGVALDTVLVEIAIAADEMSRSEITHRMREITSLENPNSVQQMRRWLAENGLETDSLDKKAVAGLLKTAPEPLGEVLTLRRQLAKSSVKKYTAMQNVVCSDGRAHGMFRFYGASRTGRWAGRILQPQNLPQNHLPDIEAARSLVKNGDTIALAMLYDSVPDVLSELIRTAFVPRDGCKLIVADYSSIEARVIAWLAGEEWKIEVFEGDGKIYEATASKMFGVPADSVTKTSLIRQKAKQAELACNYGGSTGALKAMGALEMGLAEEELKPLVDAWRAANPNIVRLWWGMDRAAKTAVKGRTKAATHGIRFECVSGMLFITLPSGRRLAYVKPRIGTNRFGGECVTYEGTGTAKRWERIESYGPKFVENIVQAISRDLLACAMRSLNDSGYRIVMHCHDEVVIEAEPDASVNEVISIMCTAPAWANGLALRAEGYECAFYQKS
jgi:DNA polymerase